MNVENFYLKNKKFLFNCLQEKKFEEKLETFVFELKKKNFDKCEIYKILLFLLSEEQVQKNEEIYNRLTDFLDRFTSWDKINPFFPSEKDCK